MTGSDGKPLQHYTVATAHGVRVWHAESACHAREQHQDAFPDEPALRTELLEACPARDHPELC